MFKVVGNVQKLTNSMVSRKRKSFADLPINIKSSSSTKVRKSKYTTAIGCLKALGSSDTGVTCVSKSIEPSEDKVVISHKRSNYERALSVIHNLEIKMQRQGITIENGGAAKSQSYKNRRNWAAALNALKAGQPMREIEEAKNSKIVRHSCKRKLKANAKLRKELSNSRVCKGRLRKRPADVEDGSDCVSQLSIDESKTKQLVGVEPSSGGDFEMGCNPTKLDEKSSLVNTDHNVDNTEYAENARENLGYASASFTNKLSSNPSKEDTLVCQTTESDISLELCTNSNVGASSATTIQSASDGIGSHRYCDVDVLSGLRSECIVPCGTDINKSSDSSSQLEVVDSGLKEVETSAARCHNPSSKDKLKNCLATPHEVPSRQNLSRLSRGDLIMLVLKQAKLIRALNKKAEQLKADNGTWPVGSKKAEKRVLSEAQLKKLSGKVQVVWSDEDILKAHCLRAISKTAYQFVNEVMGIPLPSKDAIRKHKNKVESFPGESRYLEKLDQRNSTVSSSEMRTEPTENHDAKGRPLQNPEVSSLHVVNGNNRSSCSETGVGLDICSVEDCPSFGKLQSNFVSENLGVNGTLNYQDCNSNTQVRNIENISTTLGDDSEVVREGALSLADEGRIDGEPRVGESVSSYSTNLAVEQAPTEEHSKKRKRAKFKPPENMDDLRNRIAKYKSSIVPSKFSRFTPSEFKIGLCKPKKEKLPHDEIIRRRVEGRWGKGHINKWPSKKKKRRDSAEGMENTIATSTSRGPKTASDQDEYNQKSATLQHSLSADSCTRTENPGDTFGALPNKHYLTAQPITLVQPAHAPLFTSRYPLEHVSSNSEIRMLDASQTASVSCDISTSNYTLYQLSNVTPSPRDSTQNTCIERCPSSSVIELTVPSLSIPRFGCTSAHIDDTRRLSQEPGSCLSDIR